MWMECPTTQRGGQSERALCWVDPSFWHVGVAIVFCGIMQSRDTRYTIRTRIQNFDKFFFPFLPWNYIFPILRARSSPDCWTLFLLLIIIIFLSFSFSYAHILYWHVGASNTKTNTFIVFGSATIFLLPKNSRFWKPNIFDNLYEMLAVS